MGMQRMAAVAERKIFDCGKGTKESLCCYGRTSSERNDPPLRRAGYHKYIHDPSPPAEECHEDTVSFRKPESRRTPVIVRHLKSSDSSISGMPTNPGIAIQEPSPGGASISSLVRLHWTISNALRYSEPRRRTIHNMETTIPTVHGNISPPAAKIQVIRESVSYLETLIETNRRQIVPSHQKWTPKVKESQEKRKKTWL